MRFEIVASLLCLAGLAALDARADTVVTPAADANASALANEGQGNGPFPNKGTIAYNRYQQVYTSALFGGFSNVESISGIAFRAKQPALGGAITANLTISDIIITASTTQKNDNVGLDANLNNNPGSNATVVYSGPLTLSSATTATADFGYVVSFQNPFNYAKGSGNLLLDFVIPAGSTVSTTGSIGFSLLATVTDGFPSTDGISSAFGSSATNPVGSNSTTGVVTEFFGTPTAVPEPASLGAMGFGCVALLSRKRRRQVTAGAAA